MVIALMMALGAVAVQGDTWTLGPRLPQPVTNNVVVALHTSQGWTILSLLGLDSSKRWDGVVNWAFRWDVADPAWRIIAPVPGPGRLAGTAQAVGGRVYLFGGYTVAGDGTEKSLATVDIYDPETGRWTTGAPIPVPTDDAVSGVWRDSLVYLVSGWHDRDNIPNVQVYDPAGNAWMQATPIPGAPVFGHTGGISGNTIVYVDGVRVDRNPRRFTLDRASWRGEIDPRDPATIRWERIADHPGPPVYRAGAGTVDGAVMFVGGTDNPYNYNGIGYDGRPSDALPGAFLYDVGEGRWRTVEGIPEGVMDLRGLVRVGDRLAIAGGMRAGQRVSGRVWLRPVTR